MNQVGLAQVHRKLAPGARELQRNRGHVHDEVVAATAERATDVSCRRLPSKSNVTALTLQIFEMAGV